MKNHKQILLLAGILLIQYVCSSLAVQDNGDANKINNNISNNFELHILHINDHHSHVAEETFTMPKSKLSSLSDQARKVHYGGFPRLITLIRSIQSTRTNVLKLHAGDAITGNGFYRFFGNQVDVDMMHQVCFDAFNLGNHEFDDGDAQLADFVTKLTDANSPCQNTRVLSANLQAGPNSPLRSLQDQGYVAPHTVRYFNGGKDAVAIIGVNVRDKTLSGSSPDKGTTLLDERTAVQTQIQRLQQRGINKIILLSHMGYGRDMSWMTKVEGVDVVIGAHTHTLLGNRKENMDKVLDRTITENNYPQLEKQKGSGKPICIVQAWKFAHGLGRLRIEFDAKGDVVTCGGDFIVPFQPNPSVSVEEQAEVTNYLVGLGPTFRPVPQDNKALQILQKYISKVNNDELLAKTVVTTNEIICNNAIPGGEGNLHNCHPIYRARHGSPACNLVAHAMLNQTLKADVAIQNAGGCRTDIRSGNVTYGDLMEFLPYSDQLVTLKLTGMQIKRVLEQALDLVFVGNSPGSYPYASGLRFDVNATMDRGQGRISNLQLNSRLTEGVWNDIDMSATYTVVTNSFLAAGHDGYFEFAATSQGQSQQQQLTGTTYLDAFIRYVENINGLSNPDPDTMSTQNFVGSLGGNNISSSSSSATVDKDEYEYEYDSHDELNGIWLTTDNYEDETNKTDNNKNNNKHYVAPTIVATAEDVKVNADSGLAETDDDDDDTVVSEEDFGKTSNSNGIPEGVFEESKDEAKNSESPNVKLSVSSDAISVSFLTVITLLVFTFASIANGL